MRSAGGCAGSKQMRNVNAAAMSRALARCHKDRGMMLELRAGATKPPNHGVTESQPVTPPRGGQWRTICGRLGCSTPSAAASMDNVPIAIMTATLPREHQLPDGMRQAATRGVLPNKEHHHVTQGGFAPCHWFRPMVRHLSVGSPPRAQRHRPT